MLKYFVIFTFFGMLFLSFVSKAHAANIELFDDKFYQDRSINIKFEGNNTVSYPDFKNVTASGKYGFDDKVSSVRWKIWNGYVCYLYEHKNFSGRKYALRGTGAQPDLGSFSDWTSSFKCMVDKGTQYD